MKGRTSFRQLIIAAAGALAGTGFGYQIATHGYDVDWPSTGAMMQGWAALVAAGAAAWGVKRWQQELRFKRNSEISERLLIAVEGLAMAIKIARNPPGAFELNAKFPTRGVLTGFSYKNRLQALTANEYFAELESSGHRVAAIFGEEYRNAIARLLRLARNLSQALEFATHLTGAVESGKVEEAALDSLKDVADVVIPDGEAGIAMTSEVTAAVGHLRTMFRPYL